MKIQLTFSVDTQERYAIAATQGEEGPASYHTCREALRSWALLELETVLDAYCSQLAQGNKGEQTTRAI